MLRPSEPDIPNQCTYTDLKLRGYANTILQITADCGLLSTELGQILCNNVARKLSEGAACSIDILNFAMPCQACRD